MSKAHWLFLAGFLAASGVTQAVEPEVRFPKKHFDFFVSHFRWVPIIIKSNKANDPFAIEFYRTLRIATVVHVLYHHLHEH